MKQHAISGSGGNPSSVKATEYGHPVSQLEGAGTPEDL